MYVIVVKRPVDNEGNWTWERLPREYDTRERAARWLAGYRETGHVAQVRCTDEF